LEFSEKTKRIFLYISSPYLNIYYISIPTGLPGKIEVGKEPSGIAVNSKENLIYVANTNSNMVSVIDGGTNKLLSNISVGHSNNKIRDVEVNSKSNITYVLYDISNRNEPEDSAQAVVAINGSKNNAVGRNYALENKTIRAMAVNPVTNTVYLAYTERGAFRLPTYSGSLVTLQDGLSPSK
jgi:YVTN family beta-propeller protein